MAEETTDDPIRDEDAEAEGVDQLEQAGGGH